MEMEIPFRVVVELERKLEMRRKSRAFGVETFHIRPWTASDSWCKELLSRWHEMRHFTPLGSGPGDDWSRDGCWGDCE